MPITNVFKTGGGAGGDLPDNGTPTIGADLATLEMGRYYIQDISLYVNAPDPSLGVTECTLIVFDFDDSNFKRLEVSSVDGLNFLEATVEAGILQNWAKIHPTNLYELEDTEFGNVGNIGDGQVLAYDATTEKWIPSYSTAAIGITEFAYRVNTNNVSNPNAGFISTDNSDPSLVTILYVHDTDDNGNDLSLFLDELKDGDWLNFYDRTDSEVFEAYDISGEVVKNGDVYEIPVILYDYSVVRLNNNAQIKLFWRKIEAPQVVNLNDDQIFNTSTNENLSSFSNQKEINEFLANNANVIGQVVQVGKNTDLTSVGGLYLGNGDLELNINDYAGLYATYGDTQQVLENFALTQISGRLINAPQGDNSYFGGFWTGDWYWASSYNNADRLFIQDITAADSTELNLTDFEALNFVFKHDNKIFNITDDGNGMRSFSYDSSLLTSSLVASSVSKVDENLSCFSNTVGSLGVNAVNMKIETKDYCFIVPFNATSLPMANTVVIINKAIAATGDFESAISSFVWSGIINDALLNTSKTNCMFVANNNGDCMITIDNSSNQNIYFFNVFTGLLTNQVLNTDAISDIYACYSYDNKEYFITNSFSSSKISYVYELSTGNLVHTDTSNFRIVYFGNDGTTKLAMGNSSSSINEAIFNYQLNDGVWDSISNLVGGFTTSVAVNFTSSLAGEKTSNSTRISDFQNERNLMFVVERSNNNFGYFWQFTGIVKDTFIVEGKPDDGDKKYWVLSGVIPQP